MSFNRMFLVTTVAQDGRVHLLQLAAISEDNARAIATGAGLKVLSVQQLGPAPPTVEQIRSIMPTSPLFRRPVFTITRSIFYALVIFSIVVFLVRFGLAFVNVRFVLFS